MAIRTRGDMQMWMHQRRIVTRTEVFKATAVIYRIILGIDESLKYIPTFIYFL